MALQLTKVGTLSRLQVHSCGTQWVKFYIWYIKNYGISTNVYTQLHTVVSGAIGNMASRTGGLFSQAVTL